MNDVSVKTIILYDGIACDWFDVESVGAYLKRWLGWIDVKICGDLFGKSDAVVEELAEMLSKTRVRDPLHVVSDRRIMPIERNYEIDVISGKSQATAGVVYDGNDLQRIAFGVLPAELRGEETVNIYLTERMFATWDQDDRRYHARVSLYGQPSIISTSGMVAAPARDRSVYLARRIGIQQGNIDANIGDDHVTAQDSRSAEIAKGYAMQAVFHAVSGQPFCANEDCRLFNAHWQKEMLRAQLTGDDFCVEHRKRLEQLTDLHEMTRS